jgi:peptidoglycan/xylan/chitin deacetylase (PgdA/CDA1 family)
MIHVFLSHDVDWGIAGPSISHIMERMDRFDEKNLRDHQLTNLYYNFPDYMEIEERLGVRSTFFFRTFVEESVSPPPSYHVEEYEDEIRALLRGGWEIGLHLDPFSYRSMDMIQRERKALESVAGSQIHGNRVHYMTNDDVLHQNLQKLSFKYDSSVKFSREKVIGADFGFFRKGNLIVFPITIMDALAFHYIIRDEGEVVTLFKHAVDECRKLSEEKRIMTVIWHDCSLKMKKGRQYQNVLDYLTSQRDIEVKRGIDLHESIEKGTL